MRLTLGEWLQARFVIKREDAEDIAQEARLIAFLKKNISSDQEGWQYLTTVATNLLLNERRNQRRHIIINIDKYIDSIDLCYVQDNNFCSIEDKSFLNQLKDERIISGSDWELLELHYLEDLTFQEIADRKNQPCSSTRSRVRRSLERLRCYLEASDM